MSSTFTVGRVGLDVTNRGGLTRVEMSGNAIKMSGYLIATQAQAVVLRQQLNGYVDNGDEPWVPVTSTADPSIDGWYRVVAVSIDTTSDGFHGGWMAFELDLERFRRGYNMPKVEMICLGSNRATVPAGVTPLPWHGVPSTVASYDAGTTPTVAVRSGETLAATVLTSASYFNATPTFTLSAASWYSMAATVKAAGSVVVGSQPISTPTNWELSNGLVKITPNANYLFDITSISAAAPGTWGAAKGMQAGYFDGAAFQSLYPATSITVTRNAPEESAVRLVCTVSLAGGATLAAYVDISLRRGARVASVRVTTQASSYRLGLKLTTATSCSAITSGGGIVQTSNDANTNRTVILTALTSASTDLANGAVYLPAAAKAHDLAVGHEVGGTGSALPDRNVDLRNQWFAAIHESQTVVGQ